MLGLLGVQIETPALQFLNGRPIAPIPREEAARLALAAGAMPTGSIMVHGIPRLAR